MQSLHRNQFAPWSALGKYPVRLVQQSGSEATYLPRIFLLLLLLLLSPPKLAADSFPDLFSNPTIPAGALSEPDPAPEQGVVFGVGFHRLSIQSELLGLDMKPMPPFGDGGDLMLGWNWKNFRLEFIRQTVRRPPAKDMTAGGEAVTQFGFDANQIWATHGYRPWNSIRLGYGVGYQKRVIVLVNSNPQRHADAGALAGLMMDYAFAPPFVLHLRWEWQQQTDVLSVSGQYLYLASVVPF